MPPAPTGPDRSDAHTVLSVTNLTIDLPKDGDRAHAVRDVSFDVKSGEIVCLVGESGSGKSVIAFSIMGLLAKALTVSSGSVLLNGEELVDTEERRLRDLRCTGMGMIFQEPMTALNPVMRCGDQVEEVLEEHTGLGPSERRRKVLEMIEAVHLPEPERMYRSYPHQLSGGQRQRIMIAMALILEPPLLIADEPTTALDVTTQAQILKLIQELEGERRTGVLFITHDFGVVAEIADRVAVLKQGEMVELGPARRVLSAPEHPYTKMLIGSVPSHEPRIARRSRKAPRSCCARRVWTSATRAWESSDRGDRSMRPQRCRSRYARGRRSASSANPAPASRPSRGASPG